MAFRHTRRSFIVAGGASSALALVCPRPLLANGAQVRVVGLRVDNIETPLGLENRCPRFSWRLESQRRGVRQTAYRVLVSSRENLLAQGVGDLWDSGRVSARSSLGIKYKGRELASREQCWWSVQAWDERGEECGRSEVSHWEMGLLSPADWQGQWLAAEDAVMRDDREAGLNWIWGSSSADATPRKFRLKFRRVDPTSRAVIFVGARTHLVGVWWDGQSLPLEKLSQHFIGPEPVNEFVLTDVSAGEHTLAVEVATRSGPLSSDSTGGLAVLMRFEGEDHSVERIVTGPSWRTSLSQHNGWYSPDYDDDTWDMAQASQVNPLQTWPPGPAMNLRKAFTVEKAIVRARLYATALGAYEARLNGERVGDALLTPQSTRFGKRALYSIFDVTRLLRVGANVLGLTVGDGWYASAFFLHGRYAWGEPPRRVLAQLEMDFSDGTREIVVTGPDWRIHKSAILRSDIYDGERCDARLEQPGWDSAEFDGSSWELASAAKRPSCKLAPLVSPPIRITQTLQPKAITQPKPGFYVIDFGQNFAGWCRLRARGDAGTRIELRFGEVLSPSGELDQSNLRGAQQTDVFILRGDSIQETFEPKFTYHGFRYVQISGLAVAPSVDDVEGRVIHSDLSMTGRFRVDHPLVQQVYRAVVWTQRANLMGIPTDCPQRDERFGYLGDGGIFWDAASFNMDVDAFTRQVMDNARDSQAEDGFFQPWAPSPKLSLKASDGRIPGWGEGGIIMPWTVWRRYGDEQIVEQNWEAMLRHLQSILVDNPTFLWTNRKADVGDWMSVDAKEMPDSTTLLDLIATAYWAHGVDLVAQMGYAIGKAAEADALRTLHGRVRSAFIEAFVKSDGRVGNGSQTGYVLSLAFQLIPDELREAAANWLVADIRSRGGALSTGILGTQYLLDVLANAGHADVVYDLLLRKQYPSWGYMMEKGGTTIWEGWNARVWAGPKGVSMPNSYNHYALGSICGFFFRRIAGIDADTPAFESIVVRPVLDPRVKTGGGDYDSVVGRISTEWEQQSADCFRLTMTIPANASARVHLPAKADAKVREGRQDINASGNGLRVLQRSAREVVLEAGSGRYSFFVSPS